MQNKKKKTKQEKEGISLIVLVITIIVMVILAGAIILTLNNSGIIDRAQNAVNSTNLNQVQELANVAWITAASEGIITQEGLETAVRDYLTSCGINPDMYYITVTTSGVEIRKDPYTYTIIENLTGIQANSNNKNTIKENGSVILTYVAEEGNRLPDTVTVTGAVSVWDKSTGTLTLTNPTSNVTVTITAPNPNIVAIVDTVPIPKGFVASPYSDENTKADGLVIYELASGETEISSTETQQTSWSTRNQYVWIPVDDFETEFVRTYYGTGTSDLTNTLGERGKYWEVALDTTTNLPFTTQSSTYMSSTTLAEIQAMYASVKKYGGFYVARYEMGIDSQRTSNTSISGITVHSKMNKIPFTYLQWASRSTMNVDTGGAVEVARGIYAASNTNYGVVSTLIYDVQWDRTINWIANTKLADGVTAKYPNILTDSTNYGNYKTHAITSKNELNEGASYAAYSTSNYTLGSYMQVAVESTISKDTSTNWALTTGALKIAKTNNIYDMAGNLWELTMGGYSTDRCMIRGGYFNQYGDRNPVSCRGYSSTASNADYHFSARLSLYIK